MEMKLMKKLSQSACLFVALMCCGMIGAMEIDNRNIDRALSSYAQEVDRARQRLLSTIEREIANAERRDDTDVADYLRGLFMHVQLGGDPQVYQPNQVSDDGAGWRSLAEGLPAITMYGPLPANLELTEIAKGHPQGNVMGIPGVVLPRQEQGTFLVPRSIGSTYFLVIELMADSQQAPVTISVQGNGRYSCTSNIKTTLNGVQVPDNGVLSLRQGRSYLIVRVTTGGHLAGQSYYWVNLNIVGNAQAWVPGVPVILQDEVDE